MTFQLQIDKNSFQFHIIYMGMNPLRQDASTALSNPSARCPGSTEMSAGARA